MKMPYDTCEVCGSGDIVTDGSRRFCVSDDAVVDTYTRSRLAVLFSVWFPGQQEVLLTSVHCRRCGFAVYEPRPEPADIDRKYRYLESSGVNASERCTSGAAGSVAEERSAILHDFVARHGLIRDGSSILDYGGGDGSLMSAFSKRGCTCSVVDYALTVVPGTQRLASTLQELPADRRFDGIICSHVLEHVADTGAIGRNLADRLHPHGWMYVEVPMEVWRRPLPHAEPVTHVNFFTPASVRNFLLLSNLEVIDVTLTKTVHSTGKASLVIKGIGRKSATPCDMSAPLLMPSDVETWLRPTWRSWVTYMLAYPEIWKYEVLKLVRRDLR